MTSRFQCAVILLLSFAVLAILVSPAVPTAPTTLRARHTMATLLVMAYVPAVLMMRARWSRPFRELLAIAHAPAVVDLTSARLC